MENNINKSQMPGGCIVEQRKNKLTKISVLHVVMGAALTAGASISLADVAFARAIAPSGSAASANVNPTAVARGQLPNGPAVPAPQAPWAPLKLAACTPCGGQKARCGGCNPCAAKKSGCGACNPCATKKGCGAFNPCAAKKGCGACNPCAAKKGCSACNPCAAKKTGCGVCNSCNPCAAKNACGACNPCGGAEAPELTAGQARKAYASIIKDLVAGYSKSGMAVASHYKDWKNYTTQPYVSDTHGGRFVNNYGNSLAGRYGKYEAVGRMPVGAKLAKDSFTVSAQGKVGPGPLFLMEKMSSNFNKESGNWRYVMVLPNGQVFGTTNGTGSAKVKFCYECHMAVADEQDSLMFLPDEYRVP